MGAFLRGKGLHGADINAWRALVLEGGRAALSGDSMARKGKASAGGAVTNKRTKELEKQVRSLRKELERKEHALAEAAALLVLKKRLQLLSGDADDTGRGRNER